MISSVPKNQVFLKFVFRNGTWFLKNFEDEEQARSVLDNWISEETTIIGANRSEKDPNRVWAVRADDIVFIHPVMPEEIQAMQQQQLHDSQRNPTVQFPQRGPYQ